MEQVLNRAVEGLALALCAWAVARPRLLDAAWRGRVWAAALVGLALLMAAPLATLAAPAGPWQSAAVRSTHLPAPSPVSTTAPWALVSLPPFAVPLAPMFAAWTAVALWRAGILARAVLRIRAARRAVVTLPADREARLPAWNAAARGRFPLVVSSRVTTASMLGFGRPMIALPPAWLERLDDRELDGVALHELAHAERRDDLAQLAQELLVAACWFHPAAWWIGRRIRFEREAACDERAARATSIRDYARCLVHVAETMGPGRFASPLLVPSSMSRPSQLARRVERVIRVTEVRRAGRSRLVALLAGAVACAAGVGAQSGPRVFGAAVPTILPAPAPPTLMPTSARLDRESDVSAALSSRPSPRPDRARARTAAATLAPVAFEDDRFVTVPTAGGQLSGEPARSDLADTAPPPLLAPSVGWDRLSAGVLLPAAPAPVRPVTGAAGRPVTVAAPFRAAGFALVEAGKRTGQWFSRTGVSIAEGLTAHN
jgi:beta-lactamase regulating signal transducer with metallopeptidase domain